MSRESTFWKYVKRGLERTAPGKIHLQRIEDRSGSRGVPDVSVGLWGVNIFVELKVITSWPKRPGTVVRFHKFTGPQRAWIISRGRTGGSTFFLLRVEDDRSHLLLPWTSVTLNDFKTKAELLDDLDAIFWEREIDFDVLAVALVGKGRVNI